MELTVYNMQGAPVGQLVLDEVTWSGRVNLHGKSAFLIEAPRFRALACPGMRPRLPAVFPRQRLGIHNSLCAAGPRGGVPIPAPPRAC